MSERTSSFLRMIQERNARIADREAQKQKEIDLDPIRVKREAERRERYGTLRARPRSNVAKKSED